MLKHTEEEMAAAGLSQEEMDALNDDETVDDDILSEIVGGDEEEEDELSAEEQAAIAAAAGKVEATDDKVVTNEDAAAAEAAAAEAAAEAAAAVGTEKGTETKTYSVDELPPVNFHPVMSGELLPEYREAEAALNARLDEGDISMSEHRAELRKVEAASQNAEIQAQRWKAEQETFFKHNPEFSSSGNRVVWGALNQEVIRLANDPETAELSGLQLLYMARDNVKGAFTSIGKENGKVDTPSQTPGKETIAPKPKADKKGPTTIGGLPAADTAEVGADKFAALDKLDGMELEKALERLSPAEREAYISGAY
jgi:hypothetical protein